MPYGPRADRLLKKLGAMVGRQSLRVTANSPTIVVSGNFHMSYLKIILPRKWWNSKLHDWFLICSSLSDKRRNAAVLQAYISRETGRWGPLLTNSTVLVHGFARFFSLKANTINWLERLTQGAPPSNTVTQVDHCVWRKKCLIFVPRHRHSPSTFQGHISTGNHQATPDTSCSKERCPMIRRLHRHSVPKMCTSRLRVETILSRLYCICMSQLCANSVPSPTTSSFRWSHRHICLGWRRCWGRQHCWPARSCFQTWEAATSGGTTVAHH